MIIPRAEHPFPQMVREDWINLNGEWDFEFDYSKTGAEDNFFERDSFDMKINVPFCPESKLSGIENKNFCESVWYRREFELTKAFQGKRTILHFGAVDYFATVYINGKKAGEHKGGYTAFSFDITDYITDGKNSVCVHAVDNQRSGNQPIGKQSNLLNSYGCFYTRTTGIWQTVWLEAVGNSYIKNFYTYADMTNFAVTFDVRLCGNTTGLYVNADISYDGKPVGKSSAAATGSNVILTANLSEKHSWGVGEGNLYDVRFYLTDGVKEVDSVSCYFGMRSIGFSDGCFKLNGKTLFGRWVLDQGFYPDGIYTAPTDEALKNDIEYSIKLGFNGARLHQKIFEPRFLYWADKLGYLVWEEHANWGLDITQAGQIQYFLPEWLEAIDRDFSHPSIIGWCPFNETWDLDRKIQDDSVISLVYAATKAADSTRMVIDTSGNFHTVSFEFFDIHDYEQDPNKIKEFYSHLSEGKMYDSVERNPICRGRQQYKNEPVFVSEYGGIRWDTEDNVGWGYGDAPKTEEEFLERFKGLTHNLMANDKIIALCFTQLYDVELERNGLMTYNREFKFDPEIIRKINQKKAAVEE